MSCLWNELTDIPSYSIYDNVTGLILAGGQSSRMQYQDKAFIEFQGKPMISHVIDRLSRQVSSLIISANRNEQLYEKWHLAVYADQIKGFIGPLAGILTGLTFAQTQYMVTVPCDAPFLPQFLVMDLYQALENENCDIAIACSKINNKIRHEPVFTLMKTSLKSSLETYINQGGRKIDNWHRTLHYAEVLFEEPYVFSNINTFDDLVKCEPL